MSKTIFPVAIAPLHTFRLPESARRGARAILTFVGACVAEIKTAERRVRVYGSTRSIHMALKLTNRAKWNLPMYYYRTVSLPTLLPAKEKFTLRSGFMSHSAVAHEFNGWKLCDVKIGGSNEDGNVRVYLTETGALVTQYRVPSGSSANYFYSKSAFAVPTLVTTHTSPTF